MSVHEINETIAKVKLMNFALFFINYKHTGVVFFLILFNLIYLFFFIYCSRPTSVHCDTHTRYCDHDSETNINKRAITACSFRYENYRAAINPKLEITIYPVLPVLVLVSSKLNLLDCDCGGVSIKIPNSGSEVMNGIY